ncbi:MAG TPA: queuosine precursor transporter [Phnomibacter sp.]|nr:queuosine precursor transporter [Phnomibacter sp.]
MIHNIIRDKATKLFILLGGFFIANAIIAEVIGVKIFSLEASLGVAQLHLPLFGSDFSFNLTTGVLLWPVVFIMTDIINEYYGTKGVKFLSYLTAGLISYAFVMFFVAIQLTPADWWVGSKQSTGVPNMQHAYSAIFGQGLWIIIGSLVAFLIGQMLDVLVFHKIKKVTGEKAIWARSTGSTLISQLIDSFVVLGIAFYIGPMIDPSNGAPWSLQQLMTVGVGNYIYKFVVAVVMTPVIYAVHGIIEKYLGAELSKSMKESAMQR